VLMVTCNMLTSAIPSIGIARIGKQDASPMADKYDSTMPDAAPSFHVRCVPRPKSSENLLKPIAMAGHKRHSNPKASPQCPRKEIFDMNMQPKPRRRRRCFSEGEKAVIAAVRKARACERCHVKHRKVQDTPCALDYEAITDN